MEITKSVQSARIFLLCASGFDEVLISCALSQMRGHGKEVALVGLQGGLVRGQHGLEVRPNLSLEQLRDYLEPGLALIPGYEKCAALLLSDPRGYRFLVKIMQNGGTVGVASEAEGVFRHFSFPKQNGSFFFQEWLSQADFISQLVNML